MEHLGTEIALQLSMSSWVIFTLDISTLILFFTCSTASCSGCIGKGLTFEDTTLACEEQGCDTPGRVKQQQ